MGGSYQTIGPLPDAPTPAGAMAIDPTAMEASVIFEPVAGDSSTASEPAGYEAPADSFDGAALENAPTMYEFEPVFVEPGAGGQGEDLRITTLAIGEEDGGS